MNIAFANILISTLLILQTIKKICDNIEFLISKRKIYKIFKWTHLWKYIKSEIILTNFIFIDCIK